MNEIYSGKNAREILCSLMASESELSSQITLDLLWSHHKSMNILHDEYLLISPLPHFQLDTLNGLDWKVLLSPEQRVYLETTVSSKDFNFRNVTLLPKHFWIIIGTGMWNLWSHDRTTLCGWQMESVKVKFFQFNKIPSWIRRELHLYFYLPLSLNF